MSDSWSVHLGKLTKKSSDVKKSICEICILIKTLVDLSFGITPLLFDKELVIQQVPKRQSSMGNLKKITLFPFENFQFFLFLAYFFLEVIHTSVDHVFHDDGLRTIMYDALPIMKTEDTLGLSGHSGD